MCNPCLPQVGLLLDGPLDLEQNIRFPVIELRDLIILEHSASEHLRITGFEGFDEHVNELRFARR